MNHHKPRQGGLQSTSVYLVTPADAAFITAIVDSPADIKRIVRSPAT
jgi:hypothetical protein